MAEAIRYQYGVATRTLTAVVEEYMILQGNSRRSHMLQYLITAKKVYQDLLKDTLWNVQQRIITVDEDSHTAVLPDNMSRLIAMSIIDKRNKLVPLYYNENMNTVKLLCHQNKCSCDTCNDQGSLCEMVDAITMRTEPVIIDTITYYKKIWNKKDGCNIVEVSETPYKEGNDVVYETTTTSVCKIDVGTDGCILETEKNYKVIFGCCGSYMSYCRKGWYRYNHEEKPIAYNGYGHWKYDAQCSNIIHIEHSEAKQIMVSYQMNPECIEGEEVLIPHYAENAFLDGMEYWVSRYNRATSQNEKKVLEDNYIKQKYKLFSYMRPINMEEYSRLSGLQRKWG